MLRLLYVVSFAPWNSTSAQALAFGRLNLLSVAALQLTRLQVGRSRSAKIAWHVGGVECLEKTAVA